VNQSGGDTVTRIARLLPLFIVAAGCDSSTPEETVKCTKDEQCPQGQRCNPGTSHCYTATILPDVGVIGDLKSTAAGHFSCPYYSTAQTTLSKGTGNVSLELAGKTYSLFAGCGVWPSGATASSPTYMVLVLMGTDEAAGAIFGAELYYRIAEHKPGTLALPLQARGRLKTLKDGQASTYPAAIWGGTLTLIDTPTEEGKSVTGVAVLRTTPYKEKPYGGLCELFANVGKTGADILPELLSPDCRAEDRCLPFSDGTNRGMCIKPCTAPGDCTTADPTSACLTLSSKTYCMHPCKNATECEAPMTCPTTTCLPPS